MFNLQLHITPKTEQRLKAILAHAQDQETFAQNIIAYQIAELQKGIVNIRLDLKKFEEKYKQPTESFISNTHRDRLTTVKILCSGPGCTRCSVIMKGSCENLHDHVPFNPKQTKPFRHRKPSEE